MPDRLSVCTCSFFSLSFLPLSLPLSLFTSLSSLQRLLLAFPSNMSLSSILFCVMVCLLLSVSCQAQCSVSVFTPNSTSTPSYTGAGAGWNSSFISAQPVQLLQSAVVTGVSVFPSGQQSGVLSIAGGLFAYAADSGNMTMLAQSAVVTVTDFSVFNSTGPVVPLSLPFPQSAFAFAGSYRVVYWYSWQPVDSQQFIQTVAPGLPTLAMFFPSQINTSDFTTANGVLPAEFRVTPSFTSMPGAMVSVQTASVCSSSSGFSSTGHSGAPHAAAASAALPLTFAAALVALWAVMSS